MGLAERNYARNCRLDLQTLVGTSRFSSGKQFAVKPADREGFIVCQWGLADFRYGLRGSNKNGCGWAAAYNLLKILGETPQPAQVLREFEKFGVFFGLFGCSAAAFHPYFCRKGYKVRSILTWNYARLERAVREGEGAILFYFHPKPLKGAHFAAVCPGEEGRLVFYNSLNLPLRNTGRKVGEIPLYRLEQQRDERTLKQFVADEKAYYHSRWFPSPFYGVCVCRKEAKRLPGYSCQEIF